MFLLIFPVGDAVPGPRHSWSCGWNLSNVDEQTIFKYMISKLKDKDWMSLFLDQK